MGCLADALSRGYGVSGFNQATSGDEVFFQLVLARIIETVSKAGLAAGAGGGRGDASSVPDRDTAAVRVRGRLLAAADLRCLRRAGRPIASGSKVAEGLCPVDDVVSGRERS
jgi:hypothetical protein